MNDAERAWVAMEYLAGRMQTEIANELGHKNSSIICAAIRELCDRWSGTNDITGAHVYGKERKRYVLRALRNYFLETEGEIKTPQKWRITAAALNDDKAYSLARHEHAWSLRIEGLTFHEIGKHLGVSKTRASWMVNKFDRMMRRQIETRE